MHSLFGRLGRLQEAYVAVDWASTPLGAPDTWTDGLCTVLDMISTTRFPVTLLWGPESVLLYNEAYVSLLADKHPGALGRPARTVFPEAWDVLGPMLRRAMAGEGTWVEDAYVPLHRRGFLEECYFTFSYSPVRAPDGTVEGVLDIAHETTAQVVARRRRVLLGRLTDAVAEVDDVDDLRRRALPALRSAPRDLVEVDIRVAPAGSRSVEAAGPTVDRDREGEVVWLPLTARGGAPIFLVVRLSPLLSPDEEYFGFVRAVASVLREALGRMHALAKERDAADAQRRMAEAFQRSLLPVPSGAGTPRVAVRYQAAAELAQIGGDWYDIFAMPDGTVTVVVGDVAGHDQHSAAAMAQVRHSLRGVAYTLHPAPPSEVLRGLDRVMDQAGAAPVATAVVAQLRPTEVGGLTVVWSNAGHLPPVHISPQGATSLLESPPDVLLGLDATAHRADHTLLLEPGATLLLYTDGLVERRDEPISEGLAWLQRVLRGQHRADLEVLCDDLLREAVGDEDDVALLVLRT